MAAKFDILEPGTDGRLTSANIITRVGETAARVQGYGFPGLSGEGSTYFGIGPVPITWDCLFESTAIGYLEAFEGALKEYLLGGRFTLVTELNQTFEHVELRKYEPLAELRKITNGRLLREARVHFLWMQPK